MAELSIDDYEYDYEHLYYQFRDIVPGSVEPCKLNQNKDLNIYNAEKADELQETEAEKELRELKEKIKNASFAVRSDQNEIPPRGTILEDDPKLEKKAERLVYSSTGSVYSRNAPVPIREDAPRESGNI